MKKQQKLLLLFAILSIALCISACGKKDEDNTPHVCRYSEWQVIEDPTCDEVGTMYRDCSCGSRDTQYTDPLGHDFDYDSGEFDFSGEDAVYVYSCQRNGCDASDGVTASMTVSSQTEPTCVLPGQRVMEYYVVIQGERISHFYSEDIKPLGHVFGECVWRWSDDYSEVSCFVPCERDGNHGIYYQTTISVSGSPASCTADGKITYTATAYPNGVPTTDTKVVTTVKLGHDYDYENGVWAWDGNSEATYTVACKNDPSHTVSKSASSTYSHFDGGCELPSKDTYTVSVVIDERTVTDQKEYTTEPIGHDFHNSDKELIWSEDFTSAEIVFTCARNPEHKLIIIPDVYRKVTREPTCFDFGRAEVYASYKTDDGTTYTYMQAIELLPLSHELTFEGMYVEWNGYVGATLYVPCTRGELHFLEYYSEAQKSTVSPTCTDEGCYCYTADFGEINGEYIYDEKTESIPALGHDYKISNVEWIDGGEAAKISLMCQNDYRHTHSDVVFSDSEIIKAPTCTRNGTMLYTATIECDGKEFTSKMMGYALKTGHNFGAEVCYVCGTPVYTEGLEYMLLEDGSGYSVMGIGSYNGTVLSIPNVYLGLPVLQIATEAFKDNTAITELYIPETVTMIGANSFSFCTSLCKIDFSDAHATIESGAFEYCTALTELYIPSGISHVKDVAFMGCASIVKLKVASAYIYDTAFYCLDALEELEIMEGVVSLGSAFYAESSLFSVTLPSTLTSMAPNPFNSTRLVEVKNLSSLDLSKYSFYSKLKNVYTDKEGKSNLWVDASTGAVFYENGNECYLMGYSAKVKNIVLPNDCNGKKYSIYDYAFASTNFGDGYLYIPEGVEIIRSNAFFYNDTIKIIEGGEGITAIGTRAFYDCSELMSFTLGASLKNIYTDAFSRCYRLYDVINHSTLDIKKGNAAGYYVALYAIDVVTDKNVTESAIRTIDGFVFYLRGDNRYLVGYYGKGDESNPGQLTLPSGVLGLTYSVHTGAIREIDCVNKIKVGSGVFEICSEAFAYEFEEINLSSATDLEIIGDEAFKRTAITDIFIPSSVVYIGKAAFPETLETARFGNPDGWKIDVIGMVSVDAEKLSDAESAAKYLHSHTLYYMYK